MVFVAMIMAPNAGMARRDLTRTEAENAEHAYHEFFDKGDARDGALYAEETIRLAESL
jgi:hypothetical protein